MAEDPKPFVLESVSAVRLSMLLGADDLWHHRPAFQEIVRRARDAGLAGASVWRGIEGYGASSHIHTTRMLDLADGLPVLVVVVDDEDRIRAFLPTIAELLTQATVTVEPVEQVRVRAR
ncbi:DUF190 domain-containing protein [Rhodococcus triatomae]